MRTLVPSRSLALVGAILLLGGCGYRSAYVPRADGRARMGWAYGKLVALMPPNGLQLCYRESWPGGMSPPTPPPIWGRPLPSPSRPAGGPNVVWIPYVGPPSPGASRYMSESWSGGGKGGDSSSRGLAVGVAVGILVAMPLVTAGLALDPPGIDGKIAGAIDNVNRYNDSMRRAAAPCDAVGVR